MTPDDVNHRTERQLWCAVIFQALEDATSAKKETNAYDRRVARDWFNKAGPDFREVCSLAGMDHDAVRSAALQKIEYFDKHGKKAEPRYSCNGKAYTVEELSKLSGLPASVIRDRIKSGKTGAALITRRRETIKLTYQGETRTLEEWSKITGVHSTTIMSRIKRGRTLEEALTPGRAKRTKPTKAQMFNFGSPRNKGAEPSKFTKIAKPRKVTEQAKRFTYAGQSKTLRQWSDDCGVNFYTLRNRIRKGWTIEEALTTSTRKKKPKPTRASERKKRELYEHNGERLTLAEWSERTGIPRNTIYIRIKRRRWTVDKALTTPTQKRPPNTSERLAA